MSFDLKHSELDEISYEPSYENSMSFTIVLSLMTVSMIVVGSLLVNRLRKYFRYNYYQHSNSIILSIILVIISGSAMMSPFVIKVLDFDYNTIIQNKESWDFSILYFVIIFVGQYLPIGA